MGAGKAFGETLKKYNLDDNIFKILENNKGVISGSTVLNAYLIDNNLESFKENDLDIFIEGDIKDLTDYLISKEYKIYENKDHIRQYANSKILDILSFYNENNKNNIFQIIKINIPVIEYIKNFDLSCCRIYIDNNTKKIVSFDEKNTLFKITEFFILEDKFFNIARLSKYINRGFKIYFKNRDITEVIIFANNKNEKLLDYLKSIK